MEEVKEEKQEQVRPASFTSLGQSTVIQRVTSAWKRGGSFGLETTSLIQSDSDLKFTKNFAKSIPLRGTFPASRAK